MRQHISQIFKSGFFRTLKENTCDCGVLTQFYELYELYEKPSETQIIKSMRLTRVACVRECKPANG